MDNTSQLIKIAQDNLVLRPYDHGHDLTHHYKVWENCLEIVITEGLTDINLDHLQVAAWYHDLDRGSTDHPTLTAAAKNLNVSQADIDLILGIINSHSYKDNRPESVEGKVLFDADKIEYVGCSRWLYLTHGEVSGKISLEKLLKYVNALNDRYAYVIANLNFSCTKAMIKQNIVGLRFLKDNNLLHPDISAAIDWEVLR